jgi:hypothetical protein
MSNIRGRAIILICLALVAAIALFAWAILRTRALDASAQEIALQVTENTFSTDRPTTLLENAHPDYQAAFPPEQLLRYLNNIKPQLGPLASLQNIRGSSDIPLIGFGQNAGSASYEVTLSFENSPASIQIAMLLVEERWLITQFDIYADLLAN